MDLSPEQWMRVLTAVGHYAGVLHSMNLETERTEVMETYRASVRKIRLLL
jgi:hypothetical protein